MSVAAYLACGKPGASAPDSVVELLKQDALRVVKATEVYRSVRDYDPVLRAHCRLEKEERD